MSNQKLISLGMLAPYVVGDLEAKITEELRRRATKGQIGKEEMEKVKEVFGEKW